VIYCAPSRIGRVDGKARRHPPRPQESGRDNDAGARYGALEETTMSRPLGSVAATTTLAAVQGVSTAADAIYNHWRFEHVWLDR
jgi:hypothetical protein